MVKHYKRRAQTFNKRAMAFAIDVRMGKGFKVIERDKKPIVVGTGKHRRLARKRVASHIVAIEREIGKVEAYLNENNITPKHYCLVKAQGNPRLRIQEYFEKPTVHALERYLKGNILFEEDFRLCKKFVNQYKSITLEQISKAKKELYSHWKGAKATPVDLKNIVIPGQDKNKRIRFSIIDY